MRWREFESAAPELAAQAREALVPHRVAMLGTTRRDGSARVSPVGEAPACIRLPQ